MKKTLCMVVAVVGLVSTVAAQDPPTVSLTGTRVALEQLAQTAETRARMGVQSRITKGAPYSADTTTEAVQVLGDGNRIVRKTTTRVFRDAEGRTRVEQVSASGEVETVNISDPVSGETFVLNPAKRTAYKSGVVMVTPQGSAGASVSPGGRGVITTTRTADGSVRLDGSVTVEARQLETEEARRKAVEETAAQAGARGRGGRSGEPPTVAAGGFGGGGGGRGGGRGRGTGAGAPVREEIGQQVIEGVMATGTRTTTVIAAGAIGNDQPIRIVSEQWFSDDLKVLVLTKHSDPRVGETIFRLTNISRADPAASLFVVPSDYTLEQSFIRRDR